jgi:hypothetical protein
MCVQKTPLAKVFSSSPATAPEKKLMLFYGVKLTGENIVDVGVFPGNGARKEAATG